MLWVDADAAIVDPTDDIADVLGDRDLMALVAHEYDDQLIPNCGVWVLRPHRAVLRFLERTWMHTEYLDHKWWGNAALLVELGYRIEPRVEIARRSRMRQRVRFLRPVWRRSPTPPRSHRWREAPGQCFGGTLVASLEGRIGQGGLTWNRHRIGDPVKVDPRRTSAVLISVRNRERLVQAVHAEREYLERIPRFPAEPSLDVLTGPDDFAVERIQDLRFGHRAHADDVRPPFDPNRTVGGRGGGAGYPALIRRFQQVGVLMFDGWVEPESCGLDVEVAAVFAEPTLPEIEDLLTLEQGLHHHRPFLQGGARGSGHGHVRQDTGVRLQGAPWINICNTPTARPWRRTGRDRRPAARRRDRRSWCVTTSRRRRAVRWLRV